MNIYKATNQQNTKAYIGLCQDLPSRKQQHLYEATGGSQTHFHRALRKYDIDVWEWEIIAECETREAAGNIEIQMIAEYNTFKDGYNSTTGGESNFTMSEETRAKMSAAKIGKPSPRKGITLSKEIRAKMSASFKGRISNRKGATLSKESRDKISAANKGRVSVRKGVVLSIETRKKMSEAKKGKTFSKQHKQNISKALKGTSKSKDHKRKISETLQKRYSK